MASNMIPIEWLEEKIYQADDAGDLDTVDILSWIIQTWRREHNHEQTLQATDTCNADGDRKQIITKSTETS